MSKKAEKLDTPAETVGLVCRHCQCRHFETEVTRPIPGGRIYRRRRCRNCGWRTSTNEKIVIPV